MLRYGIETRVITKACPHFVTSLAADMKNPGALIDEKDPCSTVQNGTISSMSCLEPCQHITGT